MAAVEHLTEDRKRVRDLVETHLVSLEGVDFCGVSFAGDATLVTLGTTDLEVARAQLLVVVPFLAELDLVNVEVVLTRGVLSK